MVFEFKTIEPEAPVADFGWDIKNEKVEEPVSDKIVHVLDDEKEVKIPLEAATTRTAVSPEDQQRLVQNRLDRIQEYTKVLKKVDGINQLEKEPAFVRRNIQLDNSTMSSASNVSRFNITSDENGTSLKKKINADIKTAMLAKDKEKLAALRDIKSKLMLEATSGA
eukprot:gene33035-55603_t